MFTRDFAGGLAAVVIGGLYLLQANALRVSSLADSFGPRGMPLVYGWLMVGLGLVLVAQALVSFFSQPRDQHKAVRAEWEGQGRKSLWAAGLVALALGYVLLVTWLGYLVTLIVLIGAVAAYLGVALTWRLAAVAVAGAVILWLIFVVVLDVSMPPGLLALLG